MLNKKGIVLKISPVSKGAWISVADGKNSATVGISIRELLQYMYCHSENRNEALIHFFNYRELIKAVIAPLKVDYRQLAPQSVAELIKLHDSLVAAHIPAFVQVLLKAQVSAGYRDYAPINAEIAAQLNHYVLRDVQTYKLAGAVLQHVLKFNPALKLGSPSSFLDLIAGQMENWRGALSDTGQPYRALHKTIDTWQGKVPKDILGLAAFHLEKPLHSTNVRLLLSLNSRDNGLTAEDKANLIHVIQHTKPRDISMLLQMPQVRIRRNGAGLAYGGNNNGSPYENLINYIRDGVRMDATFQHMNSLPAMYTRSLRVHEEDERRQANANRIESEARRKGQAEWMATKTAPLPFPLPEKLKEKGASIRFLDTVGAVHEESDVMGHCIHSYSKDAVAGNCYLFHVEFDGEMASAEVSPQGAVRQVRGPHNNMNEACDYAGKVLREWISDWKSGKGVASKAHKVKA